MNKEEDLPESDQSDSDFCPEKELAGDDVSEASSEESSCSDENNSTVARKRVAVKRSKVTAKKTKTRKRARAHKEAEASTDSDDDETVETCRRSTRQTDDASKNGRGTAADKDKIESDEEDKSRTEALWADFLNDVGGSGGGGRQKSQQSGKEKISTNKKCDNEAVTKDTPADTNGHHDGHSDEPKKVKSVVETATAEKPTQIKVTEVVDFAGEEVRVERIVNADSVKENTANTPQRTACVALPTVLKRSTPGAGSGSGSSGSGLGSILGQIGKKKKISVLEKSKLDWNSFKKDEGIEEELQTFNKGRDGFLERQDFLQRTDLRQFEIEKGLRQARRNQ